MFCDMKKKFTVHFLFLCFQLEIGKIKGDDRKQLKKLERQKKKDEERKLRLQRKEQERQERMRKKVSSYDNYMPIGQS